MAAVGMANGRRQMQQPQQQKPSAGGGDVMQGPWGRRLFTPEAVNFAGAQRQAGLADNEPAWKKIMQNIAQVSGGGLRPGQGQPEIGRPPRQGSSSNAGRAAGELMGLALGRLVRPDRDQGGGAESSLKRGISPDGMRADRAKGAEPPKYDLNRGADDYMRRRIGKPGM